MDFFVYGTLKDSQKQIELFGRELPYVDSRLWDHKIVMAGEYPSIERSPNNMVAGRLITLDEKQVRLADEWEGEDYICITLQVESRGLLRSCSVYKSILETTAII